MPGTIDVEYNSQDKFRHRRNKFSAYCDEAGLKEYALFFDEEYNYNNFQFENKIR